MTPMFSIFTLAIKFDCVYFTIFQSFHLFVSFIFNKLAPPPQIYVSKGALNHFLVHSSPFNGIKSAKNIVFFSFCILTDMPMGGGCSPPRPPLATALFITLKALSLCLK